MKSTTATIKHKDNGEHGTISSYVVGFILSLIFTVIPYYLVVNKVFEGTALALIILGIAIIQMFIQIFFFLHLGRGPKPLYNVAFFFATAATIVLVVGASIFIMNNLYRNMTPTEYITRLSQEENIAQIGGKETGACNATNKNHIIILTDQTVSPAYVSANMCDSLTFINEGANSHDIVFGSTGNTYSYGGIYEVKVESGDSETITLNESGYFSFYDSVITNLGGEFSVTKQ